MGNSAARPVLEALDRIRDLLSTRPRTPSPWPVKADHAALSDRLAEAADEVLVFPNDTADRRAYEAANAVLLRRADRLVVVWDGAPASGKGDGTAGTVEGARAASIPVDVVRPDGAARRSAG